MVDMLFRGITAEMRGDYEHRSVDEQQHNNNNNKQGIYCSVTEPFCCRPCKVRRGEWFEIHALEVCTPMNELIATRMDRVSKYHNPSKL